LVYFYQPEAADFVLPASKITNIIGDNQKPGYDHALQFVLQLPFSLNPFTARITQLLAAFFATALNILVIVNVFALSFNDFGNVGTLHFVHPLGLTTITLYNAP
jgi:hypothetical protein